MISKETSSQPASFENHEELLVKARNIIDRRYNLGVFSKEESQQFALDLYNKGFLSSKALLDIFEAQ